MTNSINVTSSKNILDKFLDWLVDKTLDMIMCMVIIFVGFKIINKLKNVLEKLFIRQKLEQSVITFLISFIDISLKGIIVLWGISILGVETSSVLAILGSAGIAFGLAVQGSLSNMAGGVLILLLKPFQIGDYIIEDTNKNEGTVVSIDIFYTRLYTMDNKTVVIPNGVLANASLTNVTKQDKRRIDLVLNISYNEDIKRVKSILYEVIKNEDGILNDKESPISIFVNSFEINMMTIGIRAWAPMDNFWNIRWSLLENIKERFDKENIKFPIKKLDVNINDIKDKY